MKCTHCGHENREGIKFCEECGKPLAVKAARFCSNCGHENRAGVKFCEQCGIDLVTGVLPSAAAGAQAAPPPVMVQVAAPPHKRRFNPLLLVLLLLFMIVSCCCLLMLLGLVDTPVIAAPIIEQVQNILPIKENPVVNNDQIEKQPAECVEEMEILNTINLDERIRCISNILCRAELKSPNEPWDDIEVFYGWDGTVQGKAISGETLVMSGKRFIFPGNTKSNRVDFWVGIGECRKHLGWSEGWLPDQAPAPKPPVVIEPPPLSCSEISKQVKATTADVLFGCEHETDSKTPCNTFDLGLPYPGGDMDLKYEVKYQYDGDGSVASATCYDSGGKMGCMFPAPPLNSCAVDIWVSVDGCDIYLGNKKVRSWPACMEPAPEPPVSEPAVCCEVVESKDVTLFREPPEVGTLFLGFKLTCDQPWILNNGVIDWDAYVGAESDLLWTSGSCKYFGEDSRQLECEGAVKDQKKSRTKIVLDGCPSLDINFQSPYYAPASSGCASKKVCFGVCCPNASDSCDTVDHPCSPN